MCTSLQAVLEQVTLTINGTLEFSSTPNKLSASYGHQCHFLLAVYSLLTMLYPCTSQHDNSVQCHIQFQLLRTLILLFGGDAFIAYLLMTTICNQVGLVRIELLCHKYDRQHSNRKLSLLHPYIYIHQLQTQHRKLLNNKGQNYKR